MTTETKTAEIKPEVTALAAKIKPLLKLDPKTGLITAEPDLYLSLLPEGLTKETLTALSKHNAQFVPATGLAMGELLLPAMKKHSDLENGTLTVPTVAGDKFSFAIARNHSVPAFGGKGEPTEKFGHFTAKHEMRAARNSGQFAQVRTHLSAMFADGLAKK
jgi:hypothetical protein